MARASVGGGPTRREAILRSAELLERIARTLREEVAPAVVGEYPKTQAFMAAVVLQKLSRELDLAPEHRAAHEAELRELCADLRAAIAAAPVSCEIMAALDTFGASADDVTLSLLIESLWAARDALGTERFAALLARIRTTLRAQIDRRLEVAT